MRAEIEDRLGRMPAFLGAALNDPAALHELWQQTRLGWLESPVPPAFRHALVERLANESSSPWRAVADELEQLSPSTTRSAAGWPAPGTPEHEELLALAVQLVLAEHDDDVATRTEALLGERNYTSLIAVLTYLETCRTFARANPQLATAEAAPERLTDDRSRAVMLEIDGQGFVKSISPDAARVFGSRPDAVIGQLARELFAEAARSKLDRFTDELASDDGDRVLQRTFSIVGRRNDGSEFDLILTLRNRGPEGEHGAMTAVIDVERSANGGERRAAYRTLLSLIYGGLTPEAAVDAIQQVLGWQYLIVWCFDDAAGVLRSEAVRGTPDSDVSEVEQRSRATHRPDEGIIGTVFRTGEPVWVEDLQEPATSKFRSGVWMPIGRMGAVRGVLELLSTEHRKPDPALLERWPEIVGTGGHAKSRRRDDAVDSATAARLVFEGAPVGMALLSVDPSGETVITGANRAMAKLTGYEQGELVGRSLAELTEPGDADIDAELLAELLAGQIPSYEIDKRFRAANGDVFWGEMSVALIRSEDESRQPLYFVVQLADVTARKRLDDALHVSHDRLVSIFDEAPAGMALATLDCHWVQVNHALCQILGYGEEALLRQEMTDLIVPEDAELVERYLNQLRSGEVLGYHLETRAVRADAEPIWIQLSVALVHDYTGSPAYVFAEVQDVTERKRVEEDLEQGMLIDATTGLPSRTLLFDRLEQARARLARTGRPFAVMFVEVVGLDVVAAELAPQRADAALRALSARLIAAVRSGDTVARYGSDEFVIVCEELESNDEADAIAQRIVELGQFSVSGGDREIDLAVALGLTVTVTSDDSPAGLVERADAAKHAAKLHGEAYVEYCDSL